MTYKSTHLTTTISSLHIHSLLFVCSLIHLCNCKKKKKKKNHLIVFMFFARKLNAVNACHFCQFLHRITIVSIHVFTFVINNPSNSIHFSRMLKTLIHQYSSVLLTSSRVFGRNINRTLNIFRSNSSSKCHIYAYICCGSSLLRVSYFECQNLNVQAKNKEKLRFLSLVQYNI